MIRKTHNDSEFTAFSHMMLYEGGDRQTLLIGSGFVGLGIFLPLQVSRPCTDQWGGPNPLSCSQQAHHGTFREIRNCGEVLVVCLLWVWLSIHILSDLFFLFRTEGWFKTIDSVLGANLNEDS